MYIDVFLKTNNYSNAALFSNGSFEMNSTGYKQKLETLRRSLGALANI